MEQVLKFQTNINCGDCVARVTPNLDAIKGIKSWNVDTSSKEKILTVNIENSSEEHITNSVMMAGFRIQKISNGE